MTIHMTPRTNVKAVLTVLMPYAHLAAVQGMAECIREYCQRSAQGQRPQAAESRAHFEGMLDMLYRIGQVSPLDRQQVREFLAEVDAICIQRYAAKTDWNHQYGF